MKLDERRETKDERTCHPEQSEGSKIKLSEVCEFIVDCPHSTANDEGVGFPLVRTPNVGKGRLVYNDMHRVSEDVYNQRNFRAVPQEDDLIFAREAPAGNVALIRKGEKVCLGQRTVLLRPNKQKVDPSFLTYYLLAPKQQYGLTGTANGATVAHVNMPTIRNLAIELPDIKVQRKLGGILSAYDNLIENNQKQIKLLEEAAQRLYKQWFVDLRYPGHETTPIVDGLPEGWKKEKLVEIIDYEIGGGWGEDDIKEKCDQPAFVIRGTDFYGITHGEILNIPFRYHSKTNLDARALCDGDIIFEVSGGSKTEGVAKTVLIKQALLDRLKHPVMCASFCKLIRLKNHKLSQYMYDAFFYLRKNGKTAEYDKRSASSIVNYRWKDFLNEVDILIPPNNIIEMYNGIASSAYERIINFSLSIETAKKTRDRLLPKLMNGELEV